MLADKYRKKQVLSQGKHVLCIFAGPNTWPDKIRVFFVKRIDKGDEMRSLDRILVLLPFIFFAFCAFPAKVNSQPFGMVQQKGDTESQKSLLSTPGGRFVFGQVSASEKDQFMLDTYTGRLWKISKRGDIGLFLTTIPYRTADGKYTPTPDPLQVPDKGKTGKK